MTDNIKDLLKFSQELKVLLVKDNYEVKVQLLKLLKNFFPNIEESVDGIHALEMYENHKIRNGHFYDLIITDISMPRLDGIELSKKLIEINPNQLILVISAHTESEKLLQLIDIGIYKFIQKPIDYDILLNSLSSIIGKLKREKNYLELQNRYRDIKNDNIILNKLAITDKLTSVFNRRYIDNKLCESFQDIESFSKRELSIVFIDLDDFKKINDTYGHIVGDEILVTFSNLIQSNLSKNEIFGRWGGEEFIIICNNKNKEKSALIAQQLKELIENHHFSNVEKITASFGIAEYQKGDSISSLIQKADFNLYKAKDEGKNRVVL